MCTHNKDGVTREILKGATRSCARRRDRGKFKRKLSEVNARAGSRRQNELVGKFKMATGDMVSVRRAGYGVHVHSNKN